MRKIRLNRQDAENAKKTWKRGMRQITRSERIETADDGVGFASAVDKRGQAANLSAKSAVRCLGVDELRLPTAVDLHCNWRVGPATKYRSMKWVFWLEVGGDLDRLPKSGRGSVRSLFTFIK